MPSNSEYEIALYKMLTVRDCDSEIKKTGECDEKDTIIEKIKKAVYYLKKINDTRNLEDIPEAVKIFETVGDLQFVGYQIGTFNHEIGSLIQKWINENIGIKRQGLHENISADGIMRQNGPDNIFLKVHPYDRGWLDYRLIVVRAIKKE